MVVSAKCLSYNATSPGTSIMSKAERLTDQENTPSSTYKSVIMLGFVIVIVALSPVPTM